MYSEVVLRWAARPKSCYNDWPYGPAKYHFAVRNNPWLSYLVAPNAKNPLCRETKRVFDQLLTEI
ncbi:MAG: hypothetical protein EAZ91_16520 [Cytophagales bacterium]|nr:MAG: hypothetical protein EAZ91_16520 [Cytophagales bacterium]